MNLVEAFKLENEEVMQYYKNQIDKVKNINKNCMLKESLKDYFVKVSNFLCLLNNIKELVESNNLDKLSLDELKDLNYNLYEDILEHKYESSYSNPQYAVKVFNKDLGQILSYIYTRARKEIESAFAYRLFSIVPVLEIFNKTYDSILNDENNIDEIKNIIKESIYKNNEKETDFNFRKFIDKDINYLGHIILNSDLSDLRYLYKYDSYISEREIKIAEFFNSLSQDKIDSMVNTYSEGYKRGYVNCNLDIKIKKFVNIYYSIGFERMARKAKENFEKMGLSAVYTLYQPYYTNRQFTYDHRYDHALYLTEEFVKLNYENMEKACMRYSDVLGQYGGPAAIETFGERKFEPQNKEEAISLNESQIELESKSMREARLLRAKYMRSHESSFTIIAYPVPEIGEQFEEIFNETIKLNNLDNNLYEKIQQTIIDELDKGDYVHILGNEKNKTDLIVKLNELENPEKETLFENCTADVNIPVGEVFTSPKLKGTNGILHVTEAFLNGLKYINLEISLKDGMISEYTCKNFDLEEDNKKFIKENILRNHESIPMGEFAIGTNTLAYIMGQRYNIQDKLPILIAEKTGPHFAMGDTCYSMSEENETFNPNGKKIVAKDNECSLLRKTDISKAYFNCHTDITIPYDELGEISVYNREGEKITIIKNGRFILKGTEILNEPFNY